MLDLDVQDWDNPEFYWKRDNLEAHPITQKEAVKKAWNSIRVG